MQTQSCDIREWSVTYTTVHSMEGISASPSPPLEIYSFKDARPPPIGLAAKFQPMIGPQAQLKTLSPPANGQPFCTPQHQSLSAQNTWLHPSGPDVHNWQYITGSDQKLIALSKEGHVGSALNALFVAIDEQVSLSSIEIACHSLLSRCEKKKSLHQAQQLHVHLASYGLDIISSLGEHLVLTYVKCCSFRHALSVFHMLPHRTAFSWTAIINAHLDHSEGHIALETYKLMQKEGVQPSKVTFLSLFRACGSLLDLVDGRALHVDAQRIGLDCDTHIGSALVSMYGRCGDVVAAEDVFHGMTLRDVVSWSAILSAYLEQAQSEKVLLLFRQMHEEGLRPDLRLIMIALQACCILAEKEEAVCIQGCPIKVMSLEIGKGLHADALRICATLDLFVSSTLVSMYSKCGDIVGAKSVFDSSSQRDVVLWAVMLSSYVEQGEGEVTLRLFRQMQHEGVRPDDQSFTISLQACSILADSEAIEERQFTKPKTLEIGEALHMDAQRLGFLTDVFVGSALVTMYGKCGNINKAEQVFDELPFRDIIIWNAMLSAYVQQGDGKRALDLFKHMQDEGMGFEEHTLVTALQACSMFVDQEQGLATKQLRKFVALEIGEALHVDILMEGFNLSAAVAGTLISMYNRCGKIVEAEKVFMRMPVRGVVSWNAMLSAYVDHGLPENALKLYQQMLDWQVLLDDVTLGCILQACSELGNIQICKEIHFVIASNLNELSLLMATTLVHAYGSCSSMADSLAIFCKMPQQDVVSWNAFISGNARGGNSAGTLEVFEKMLQLGIKPNGLTFLPVLSVCRHAGLVDKGVAYFESMSRDYGITPKIEHYSSIIDLLVRAGDLSKVVDVFSRMPVEPDLAMWICVLDACNKYTNVELGRYAFDHAVHLQPKEPASYILMSNIYAEANMHELAAEVDDARRREGA